MCDYSLHGVASRPAKVGDKLITTQFYNTSTGGFSAEGDEQLNSMLKYVTEIEFGENDSSLPGAKKPRPKRG